MSAYEVGIEYRGSMIRVGRIIGNDSTDARFSYAESYLERPDASPVSVSLPLMREAFSPSATRCFFEGLLPEGFTRRSVEQWMHLNDLDYLSLLYNLGKECLGAIRIRKEGDEEISSYEKLDMAQVKALAAEGATKSAEFVTKSHLSLTGASGKVGLYYRDADEAWYLPKGSAPSTHIVKQSHVRLHGIVTNEQLCLKAAGKCGIPVPDSFIIDTGKGRDSEILLATKRYDRIMPSGADSAADHITPPHRLHQEDFAQALGKPPSEKYETEGGHYLKEMFDLLLTHSADPIRDRLSLWDRVVFSCLAGNSDAHIKNYSLLYSDDLKRVRLAPAYDILSTSIYKSSTRELSIRVGDADTLDGLTEASFRLAAREVGLGERLAMRRFDDMRRRFVPALMEESRALVEKGFEGAEKMAEEILETGGMKHL